MDAQDYFDSFSALAWQVDLGADEAIGEEPVNRYEAVAEPVAEPVSAPRKVAEERPERPPIPAKPAEVDQVAAAVALAAGATDLDALDAAVRAFEGCELKRGARSCVLAEGDPRAQVMVIGDAPGRDEDRAGTCFAGSAGTLFDAMFKAIDLGREAGLYVTLACPWRPPQDRAVTGPEMQMLKPFLMRRIELAGPDVIVAMGNTACAALFAESGISRLRGQWREVEGRAVLPMLPPATLLQTPSLKREAWADLLSLKAKL